MDRLTVQIVPSDVNPSRSDIGRLNDVWEIVRSHALSQRESLDFITRMAEKRWT
jgi:hypothetical protein